MKKPRRERGRAADGWKVGEPKFRATLFPAPHPSSVRARPPDRVFHPPAHFSSSINSYLYATPCFFAIKKEKPLGGGGAPGKNAATRTSGPSIYGRPSRDRRRKKDPSKWPAAPARGLSGRSGDEPRRAGVNPRSARGVAGDAPARALVRDGNYAGSIYTHAR